MLVFRGVPVYLPSASSVFPTTPTSPGVTCLVLVSLFLFKATRWHKGAESPSFMETSEFLIIFLIGKMGHPGCSCKLVNIKHSPNKNWKKMKKQLYQYNDPWLIPVEPKSYPSSTTSRPANTTRMKMIFEEYLPTSKKIGKTKAIHETKKRYPASNKTITQDPCNLDNEMNGWFLW